LPRDLILTASSRGRAGGDTGTVAGVLPNPQMQPTGRSGRHPPLGHSAPWSALWNVGLCAGRLEGLQLICKSLGRRTEIS
jgi:hypothetical protein